MKVEIIIERNRKIKNSVDNFAKMCYYVYQENFEYKNGERKWIFRLRAKMK